MTIIDTHQHLWNLDRFPPLAREMADKLLEHGIYVIGFSFPVVPKGEARILTQMSAGLTDKHVDQAIDAFGTVGHELGVIN